MSEPHPDEAPTQRYPVPQWGPPVLPPVLPPRRRRAWPGLLTVVLVLVVAAAGWYLGSGRTPSLPLVTAPSVAPVEAPRTVPTPGGEESDEPLGTPPTAPDSDVYAFVAEQADGVTPVAYDPCRPVAVVLSTDGAPEGAEAMLVDALARMTAVTGLQFRYDGPTDEVPGGGRAAYQPDRYGDRWAPVVVGWRTPSRSPAWPGTSRAWAAAPRPARTADRSPTSPAASPSTAPSTRPCWPTATRPWPARSCCTSWATSSGWRTCGTRSS
ncbi:hypothetical protein ACFQX8_12580 [Klenkia terrae]|uniref:hypothetical protein n=1 Tax=Klenkia terrae TaxID=1052259 RepID=UPI00361C7FBF